MGWVKKFQIMETQNWLGKAISKENLTKKLQNWKENFHLSWASLIGL